MSQGSMGRNRRRWTRTQTPFSKLLEGALPWPIMGGEGLPFRLRKGSHANCVWTLLLLKRRKGKYPMARQRKPQHRDQTVPGAKGVKPSRAHNTQSPNQAQGVTARRLAMLANGYAPLPAHKKAVYLTDWVNVVPTEEMIQGWEQQYPDWRNSGIATRKTRAIDIDIKDEPVAEQLEELVRKRFSNGGRLLRRIGMPPKRAFLFKTTAPFAKLKEEFIAPDGSKHKIEILCDGQQVIAD